jgi:hypothetical protein
MGRQRNVLRVASVVGVLFFGPDVALAGGSDTSQQRWEAELGMGASLGSMSPGVGGTLTGRFGFRVTRFFTPSIVALTSYQGRDALTGTLMPSLRLHLPGTFQAGVALTGGVGHLGTLYGDEATASNDIGWVFGGSLFVRWRIQPTGVRDWYVGTEAGFLRFPNATVRGYDPGRIGGDHYQYRINSETLLLWTLNLGMAF